MCYKVLKCVMCSFTNHKVHRDRSYLNQRQIVLRPYRPQPDSCFLHCYSFFDWSELKTCLCCCRLICKHALADWFDGSSLVKQITRLIACKQSSKISYVKVSYVKWLYKSKDINNIILQLPINATILKFLVNLVSRFHFIQYLLATFR